MSDQTKISSPKPTSPAEMFTNENYLDEPQDIESKRTIINCIKEFVGLKEGTKKLFNELRKMNLKRINA